MKVKFGEQEDILKKRIEKGDLEARQELAKLQRRKNEKEVFVLPDWMPEFVRASRTLFNSDDGFYEEKITFHSDGGIENEGGPIDWDSVDASDFKDPVEQKFVSLFLDYGYPLDKDTRREVPIEDLESFYNHLGFGGDEIDI